MSFSSYSLNAATHCFWHKAINETTGCNHVCFHEQCSVRDVSNVQQSRWVTLGAVRIQTTFRNLIWTAKQKIWIEACNVSEVFVSDQQLKGGKDQHGAISKLYKHLQMYLTVQTSCCCNLYLQLTNTRVWAPVSHHSHTQSMQGCGWHRQTGIFLTLLLIPNKGDASLNKQVATCSNLLCNLFTLLLHHVSELGQIQLGKHQRERSKVQETTSHIFHQQSTELKMTINCLLLIFICFLQQT